MKILTNFYFDLNGTKSFISGTKSQQDIFQNFLKNKGNYELFGLFAKRADSGEEFKTISPKENFYGLSLPQNYSQESAEKCSSLELRECFSEAFRSIDSVFERVMPDIVFLNGFSWLACLLGWRAQEKEIPVVFIHAGLTFKEFDLYRDYLGDKQADAILKGEKSLALNRKCFHIFLNEFSRNVYEKEFLKQKCPNCFIVPLGASFDFHCPAKRSAVRSKIKVGLIGRWDRIKNHQAFLNLAKHARSENVPAEFFAITRIPEKTKALGISRSDYYAYVEVRDLMPREDLWKFYQEMDVVVCPSLFDVSPHTVLESIICGTPALISPNVGYVDLYRKFKLEHWIDDFSDPAETMEKIERISLEKISPELISWIKEEYDPETVFEKYLEIINLAS